MTKRERVLSAMSHQIPDRVPKEADFTPAVQERFEKETGQTDPAAYFDYDIVHEGFRGGSGKPKPDFAVLCDTPMPEGTEFGEYGTASSPGSFYHFNRLQFIMRNWTDVKQLEEYPWPDYASEPGRWAGLNERVAKLHEEGRYVTGWSGHMYETAWQLTTMEKLLTDFVLNPEFAAYVLDRIAENNLVAAVKMAEAGCDCLKTGDDVGMQDRLMMSPATWRKWLKPRWARIFAAAREIKPDIQIWYHSDGSISEIIPDLIEIGLDILNPVQPECLDQAAVKQEYGDRLAFWGCIGTQTTMPFGTPDEVRAKIKWLIETMGAGGGLLLAPTHVLEPDVPWENILAMFEAIEEYGDGTEIGRGRRAECGQ